MTIINQIITKLKSLTSTTIIIILLLICGFIGWKFYSSKINKLNTKIEAEVKLKNALVDKVTTFKNNENEWVAEKLTLQGKVSDITDKNNKLTANQSELIARVKEVNAKNSIITAALIETKLSLDSLRQGIASVDTINKNVVFNDSTKNIQYKIKISNVLPALKGVSPKLSFLNFTMPNKQLIEFHWITDNKAGYPVSFSVSNSNDYFKVINVDSYAIPNLQKDIVDPNAWQKIIKFFSKSQNAVITIGIAGTLGYLFGKGIL